MELIRRSITHPKIYPFATDDGCPPVEQFSVVEHPSIIYLAVYSSVASTPLGIFMFVPENCVTVQVHTCLLPEAIRRPGRSLEAADAARRWIWESTPYHRITTHVPASNTLALRFAQNAGLIEFGRNPMSWLKHGKLHDQVLLGISRPEGI